MKNYKYATWITLLLWIFPLVFYIISDCVDNEFWKNIFIALFGSAILSFITSAIAYRQQRKDTLEKFYNRTNEISPNLCYNSFITKGGTHYVQKKTAQQTV